MIKVLLLNIPFLVVFLLLLCIAHHHRHLIVCAGVSVGGEGEGGGGKQSTRRNGFHLHLADDPSDGSSRSGSSGGVLGCCHHILLQEEGDEYKSKAYDGNDYSNKNKKNSPQHSLISCLQQAEEVQSNSILSRLSVDGGPSLTVGIVTYASRPIWSYSAYSFGVNLAYSERNNYVFKYIYDGDYEKTDERWSKIKILEEALDPSHGWARNFDFVMWIDADLIFLDFSFRLESIFAENPGGHVFISSEHSGSSTRVNTGSVLVRNTAWSRRFISDWWGFANRTLFSDQEQLDMLYEHHRKLSQSTYAIQKRLVILSPDAINSDPPAMTRQSSSSRVLHLMGEDDLFRQIAFKEALKQVCTSAKVEVILPYATENDDDDDDDGHSSSPELIAAVANITPLSCLSLPSTIPVNQIADGIGEEGEEKEKEEERISSLIEYMSALIFNESAKPDPYIDVDIDSDIDFFGANCTSSSSSSRSSSSSSSSSYKVFWSGLPPQLSLTQSRLLQLTLTVYGRLVGRSILFGRLACSHGCMGLRATRQLSNQGHHFAHALSHLDDRHYSKGRSNSNVSGNKLLSWALREEVFRIMYDNVMSRRVLYNNRHATTFDKSVDQVSRLRAECKALRMSGKGGEEIKEEIEEEIEEEDWGNWPEQLKLVAEAGQHLMGSGPTSVVTTTSSSSVVNSSSSSNNNVQVGLDSERSNSLSMSLARRGKMAGMVADILFEILSICHTKQKDAVRLMISHTFMDWSLIAADYYTHSLSNSSSSSNMSSSSRCSGNIPPYKSDVLVERFLVKMLIICNSISFNIPLESYPGSNNDDSGSGGTIKKDNNIVEQERVHHRGSQANPISEPNYFYSHYLDVLGDKKNKKNKKQRLTTPANKIISEEKEGKEETWAEVGGDINNPLSSDASECVAESPFGMADPHTSMLFALIAAQTSYKVSATMGLHILVTPLSHLGALLASKHSLFEALVVFGACLKVAPRSNGPALLPLLTNYINALRDAHSSYSSSSSYSTQSSAAASFGADADKLAMLIDAISDPKETQMASYKYNNRYLVDLADSLVATMEEIVQRVPLDDPSLSDYQSLLQMVKV